MLRVGMHGTRSEGKAGHLPCPGITLLFITVFRQMEQNKVRMIKRLLYLNKFRTKTNSGPQKLQDRTGSLVRRPVTFLSHARLCWTAGGAQLGLQHAGVQQTKMRRGLTLSAPRL